MKKSKHIELVLITAALASCAQEPKPTNDWENGNTIHVRADSTAPYTRVHSHHSGIGNALLWYLAFRPYGSYNNYTNSYNKAGYYSGGIAARSNTGTNTFKSGIVRGGFGRSSYSVSS
jgi:hypothetical protein